MRSTGRHAGRPGLASYTKSIDELKEMAGGLE